MLWDHHQLQVLAGDVHHLLAGHAGGGGHTCCTDLFQSKYLPHGVLKLLDCVYLNMDRESGQNICSHVRKQGETPNHDLPILV